MKGLGKRIARLENDTSGGMDYLQLLTLDDLVISDTPAMAWPDEVTGVRFLDGSLWSDAGSEAPTHWRRDGESIVAFRDRLCREHGVRGPAGAFPWAVVDLIHG
jgi:hypothetical protein